MLDFCGLFSVFIVDSRFTNPGYETNLGRVTQGSVTSCFIIPPDTSEVQASACPICFGMGVGHMKDR